MNNTDILFALNNLKDSFLKESEDIFAVPIREFLEDNPEVKGVSWTQYTPYFNDGDACIFDVNEFSFYLISDESDFFDYSKGYTTWYPLEESETPNYQQINKEFDNLCDFLCGIDKELYRTLFGDHVQVIVTRDEVIKRSHKHE